MVIHKDDFPVDALKAGLESSEEGTDILALFIGGDYYA
jgi:hypothetical protein